MNSSSSPGEQRSHETRGSVVNNFMRLPASDCEISNPKTIMTYVAAAATDVVVDDVVVVVVVAMLMLLLSQHEVKPRNLFQCQSLFSSIEKNNASNIVNCCSKENRLIELLEIAVKHLACLNSKKTWNLESCGCCFICLTCSL